MGIYDREYYREESGGFQVRKPGTIIGWLIIINIVVFLVNGLFRTGQYGGPVNDLLGLQAVDLLKPWFWWRFLTYGFCHQNIPHIFGNMLGLFFLGPPVEQRYGSREFLRLYLVLIVVSGLGWAAAQFFPGGSGMGGVVGASGAVTGVVVLFALNYPRQTVLLMMILPIPAWLLGVLVVASDIWGSIEQAGQIAYQAHLAGTAMAFLYWQGGWSFTRLTDKFTSGKLLQRRPKLRVHHPDEDIPEEKPDKKEAARAAEMDRILAKLHQEGEESLTRKERRTLQNESRRLREKRRDL